MRVWWIRADARSKAGEGGRAIVALRCAWRLYRGTKPWAWVIVGRRHPSRRLRKHGFPVCEEENRIGEKAGAFLMCGIGLSALPALPLSISTDRPAKHSTQAERET